MDMDAKELIEAIDMLEKEKGISKEILLEAIEGSLIAACKNNFGKADNIRVNINQNSGEITVYAEKTVVEEVVDPVLEMSQAEAAIRFPKAKHEIGDIVNVEVTPKNFGRIAAQKAKQVVVQKIREEERKAILNQFRDKDKEVVTGIVQKSFGRNISINLGKCEAVLMENEQIRGEVYRPNDRIKVYVMEVKETTKGPRITVSRSHPDLVKRLFESEVAEIADGVVEIKAISRDAGSRTKMAVKSNDFNVDPVGACVGVNGARVNAIVNELHGEKIDIVNWSDYPEELIENALSPSKVISVAVDEEERTARVIVPDQQLSLAIGREGQNARLAAKLTGFKIDIKSESQVLENPEYAKPMERNRDFGRDVLEEEEGYYDEMGNWRGEN